MSHHEQTFKLIIISDELGYRFMDIHESKYLSSYLITTDEIKMWLDGYIMGRINKS